MLFKSLHKNTETDDKVVTAEELHQQLEQKMKKYHRNLRIKKILLVIVISLGLIGGYKALGETTETAMSKDAENQTFVKTYATHYYAYPTEEHNDYLNKYTLDDAWKIQYETGIEYARLSNTEIYKVKLQDKETNIISYYLYGDLATKKEKEEEVIKTIYFRIDVAKEGSSFLVVKPVYATGVNIASIDKEEQEKYIFKANSSSQKLNEKEEEDLKDTLQLFIKTYNDNPSQAKLLTSNTKLVEDIDENVKLSLESITNSSQDEEVIHVTALIKESYLNVSSMTKKYYFEIEKTKNKIQKMEVY